MSNTPRSHRRCADGERRRKCKVFEPLDAITWHLFAIGLWTKKKASLNKGMNYPRTGTSHYLATSATSSNPRSSCPITGAACCLCKICRGIYSIMTLCLAILNPKRQGNNSTYRNDRNFNSDSSYHLSPINTWHYNYKPLEWAVGL
jgi:hypothetical protein